MCGGEIIRGGVGVGDMRTGGILMGEVVGGGEMLVGARAGEWEEIRGGDSF